MIAIIQCAGRKSSDAGHIQRRDRTKVMFVAEPAIAPPEPDCVFAHPDDVSDYGPTWRQVLVSYNANPGNNPLGLKPAFELYKNPAYRALVKELGASKVFILSAGWGLIGASFLTPNYDITFNAATKRKHPWKFRKRDSHFEDLCQLPSDTVEPVVFFGGKDYVPLFCRLTGGIASNRTIFYRTSKLPEQASKPPDAPGCALEAFPTNTSTNWHYERVKAFLKSSALT
ncbi:MAG: hypothetical protein JWR80_477 [Bradyrhizobium sp.]|nr:hypothetical protein [Bradyrhizobium sp.]